MEVSLRLRRNWTLPNAPNALVLPDSLWTTLEAIHGSEAIAAYELPAAYVAFLREFGGGFQEHAPDGALVEQGWEVFTWQDALDWTESGYQRYATDLNDIEEDRERSVRMLVEAGIWLHVGARARHDHFLCCDHRRDAFGRVIDLNDGHPAFGLVSDVEWPSFEHYVGGR